MVPDLESDLTSLIATCECAIRRGDVHHLEVLHTFQQQLVTARDARRSSETEAELRAAMEVYFGHVPPVERTTTFEALTEEVERLQRRVETVDDRDRPQKADS